MSLKLLVADDSVTIQKVVALAFEEEDVEVITADNGESAFELALAQHPDIILVDSTLDRLNGFDLSRKIKQTPSLEYLQVIILTSDFDEPDAKQLEESLADDFISKPFKSEDLIQKVAALTGGAFQAGQASASESEDDLRGVESVVEELAVEELVAEDQEEDEDEPLKLTPGLVVSDEGEDEKPGLSDEFELKDFDELDEPEKEGKVDDTEEPGDEDDFEIDALEDIDLDGLDEEENQEEREPEAEQDQDQEPEAKEEQPEAEPALDTEYEIDLSEFEETGISETEPGDEAGGALPATEPEGELELDLDDTLGLGEIGETEENEAGQLDFSGTGDAETLGPELEAGEEETLKEVEAASRDEELDDLDIVDLEVDSESELEPAGQLDLSGTGDAETLGPEPEAGEEETLKEVEATPRDKDTNGLDLAASGDLDLMDIEEPETLETDSPTKEIAGEAGIDESRQAETPVSATEEPAQADLRQCAFDVSDDLALDELDGLNEEETVSDKEEISEIGAGISVSIEDLKIADGVELPDIEEPNQKIEAGGMEDAQTPEAGIPSPVEEPESDLDLSCLDIAESVDVDDLDMSGEEEPIQLNISEVEVEEDIVSITEQAEDIEEVDAYLDKISQVQEGGREAEESAYEKPEESGFSELDVDQIIEKELESITEKPAGEASSGQEGDVLTVEEDMQFSKISHDLDKALADLEARDELPEEEEELGPAIEKSMELLNAIDLPGPVDDESEYSQAGLEDGEEHPATSVDDEFDSEYIKEKLETATHRMSVDLLDIDLEEFHNKEPEAESEGEENDFKAGELAGFTLDDLDAMEKIEGLTGTNKPPESEAGRGVMGIEAELKDLSLSESTGDEVLEEAVSTPDADIIEESDLRQPLVTQEDVAGTPVPSVESEDKGITFGAGKGVSLGSLMLEISDQEIVGLESVDDVVEEKESLLEEMERGGYGVQKVASDKQALAKSIGNYIPDIAGEIMKKVPSLIGSSETPPKSYEERPESIQATEGLDRAPDEAVEKYVLKSIEGIVKDVIHKELGNMTEQITHSVEEIAGEIMPEIKNKIKMISRSRIPTEGRGLPFENR